MRELEQDLSLQYPHGLPVGQLQFACELFAHVSTNVADRSQHILCLCTHHSMPTKIDALWKFMKGALHKMRATYMNGHAAELCAPAHHCSMSSMAKSCTCAYIQAGKMREARGLGIKLGGLGFGFPSSMTDQHTNIMRTMTKPRSTASFRIA